VLILNKLNEQKEKEGEILLSFTRKGTFVTLNLNTIMETNQIGENAGIVWRMLESKGNLTFEDLRTETKLDMPELFTAIGWLAREGKISFMKDKGVTSVRLYQERYY
jgi:hypothetical protein